MQFEQSESPQSLLEEESYRFNYCIVGCLICVFDANNIGYQVKPFPLAFHVE